MFYYFQFGNGLEIIIFPIGNIIFIYFEFFWKSIGNTLEIVGSLEIFLKYRENIPFISVTLLILKKDSILLMMNI